jgi:hypothetical protein
MLNKLAKCQTERASTWHSNFAVKAVHVTPAQRVQKRNFAHLRHSKKLRHIGTKFGFWASELRQIGAKTRFWAPSILGCFRGVTWHALSGRADDCGAMWQAAGGLRATFRDSRPCRDLVPVRVMWRGPCSDTP